MLDVRCRPLSFVGKAVARDGMPMDFLLSHFTLLGFDFQWWMPILGVWPWRMRFGSLDSGREIRHGARGTSEGQDSAASAEPMTRVARAYCGLV